uniref:EGF-like domain-containing protein n=1 Tax=Haemonchus contortus TaxID=6289 RepID=A0A7I4YIW7_HAECO
GETAMPARIVEPTPRYHGHKHCNRNVFMLLNLNDILHGSGPNETVHVGGTIQVGCPSSGGDGNITLTCEKTGSFVPSPSTLSCTSGVKTPFNSKELKSCEQCDAFGTETCEKTKSGVACQCRENWSGQTCWKAADQCDITHLQCGKHGVCRSEVDYASCACDYGFTGEHCNVSKTNTTIISSHKSFGDLASAAGVLVLTWYDIVIMVIKAVLLIHSPSMGHDPQSHYQNCRSFVMLIAGFLVIFFRHPSLFSLSDVECQWVFYIISSCYSLGIAFFAIEAMNAYELCTLEQLNSWTTLFPERPRSYALLAFRTGFPVVAMAIAILVILAPNYEQAISSWSCMGPFTQGTIDLWSPMVLIQMCFALIASSFSYRGLFIRKNLPHNLKKVEAYLENVSARRRNEVEKCERDLTFTAIGPWLLLLYWLTLTMSNDFVGVPYTSFLAVAFAVLYGMCNFLQSVVTTPAEYSNFMWYVMRFFPSLYAPKFDPVTMFSRNEVLEVFRQRKIDAEKGNESKWKGLLVWNSTYPDYLPTYARSKMLKEWNHSYMDARNSGKTKVKACYAVYKQHVLEMDLNSFHAKQTRELFLEWNVHIRRADPLPEPVEHPLTEEKKLEQDFIAVLRNVFLPNGQEEGNTVNRASMENPELRFPLCSVSSIDNQGNVTQLNVLKAPLDVKGKEEHLLSMSDDSSNEFIGGGSSDRNCEWAMTRHEKIKAAAQAQADVVWDMAVQNCDIIQYSKALTC